MSDTKVLVAMSGGVDSSVAAYLVSSSGLVCAGATMRLCDEALLGRPCDADSVRDAESVADRLGVSFYVFNETDAFREQVVDRFIRCYEEGGTPNPCIDCNRHIKFDVLLQRALALGFDHIATGHYAKIVLDEASGRYLLPEPADNGYAPDCARDNWS